MSQPEAPLVIDFDALRAPIPGESASGIDLREDPKESRKYYDVRDLRKAEIDNERANQRFALMNAEDLEYELSLLQSDPRRAPNWGLVVSKASALLAESSKDLWVVAWLIEALVREHGIPGLRDGIRLCRQLCEEYWDTIWPRPNEEEGGHEWTLSQLNGLNKTLSTSLEHVALFRSELLAPKERVMTLLTYAEAEKLNRLPPDVRSVKIADGATCLEDFQNAAGKKAPIEELLEHSATIESAIREMSLYYETLKGLTPVALEVSGIEETLARYSNRFDQLTKSRIASERSAGAENALTAESDQGSIGTQRSVSTLNKQIMTRDDALDGLLKVADFFRRTEPHSPVSYALEQAVRWGRMPLPKLLEDLVSDSVVREEMFRRLGIQNPSDDAYSGDDQNSGDGN